MDLLIRGSGIVLLAALSACDFVRAPTAITLVDAQPIVHAMLSAGSSDAMVLLGQLVLDDGVPVVVQRGFHTRPIQDAEVLLISERDTTRLIETFGEVRPGCQAMSGTYPGQERGCYIAELREPIAEGGAYELSIRLPDGRFIEGHAVVPERPVLTEMGDYRFEPPSRDNGFSTVVSVPLRFRATGAVPGLGVHFRAMSIFAGEEILPGDACPQSPAPLPSPAHPGDTVTAHLYLQPCFAASGADWASVEIDSLHVNLYLTGYDEAYTRYAWLVTKKIAEVGGAAEGVVGAYGVFAAEATSVRSLTLRLPVAE